MRNACSQYGIEFLQDQASSNSNRVAIAPTSASKLASMTYDNREWSENIYDTVTIKDTGASWACMRRSMFGYAAFSAKQSADNNASIR